MSVLFSDFPFIFSRYSVMWLQNCKLQLMSTDSLGVMPSQSVIVCSLQCQSERKKNPYSEEPCFLEELLEAVRKVIELDVACFSLLRNMQLHAIGHSIVHVPLMEVDGNDLSALDWEHLGDVPKWPTSSGLQFSLFVGTSLNLNSLLCSLCFLVSRSGRKSGTRKYEHCIIRS